MDLVRTAPASPGDILSVLTVQELKVQKRITHSMEDELLAELIQVAFDYFDGPEGWLRRAVVTSEWTYYRRCLAPSFELPMAPLRSVTSIAYRDDDGAWVTIDPATYEVVADTLFGRVVLALNQSWPDVTERDRAVRIVFSAGYDVDNVPAGIKMGIRLLAGSLYEHREADFEDQRVTTVSRRVEYGLERLAGRYRILNDIVSNF